MCFPQNKGILLFNLSMVIKFRKLTLIQCYYLIHRLFSFTSCLDDVLYSKRKKTAFWSFICDMSCKYVLLVFQLSFDFVVTFFLFAVQN